MKRLSTTSYPPVGVALAFTESAFAHYRTNRHGQFILVQDLVKQNVEHDTLVELTIPRRKAVKSGHTHSKAPCTVTVNKNTLTVTSVMTSRVPQRTWAVTP